MIDLLHGVREYVYPVGRLDYDTEGLLLLTNDGDLAARLTHPRHGVERTYEARVAGIPDAAALDRLRNGIPLDGRRTLPADVALLNARRAAATAASADDSRRTKPSGAPDVRSGRSSGAHTETHPHWPAADRRLKPGEWRELAKAPGGSSALRARPALRQSWNESKVEK